MDYNRLKKIVHYYFSAKISKFLHVNKMNKMIYKFLMLFKCLIYAIRKDFVKLRKRLQKGEEKCFLLKEFQQLCVQVL
jgi:hypothetical protein